MMNTHLDDQGSTARLEGSKIIAQRADALALRQSQQPLPVVLSGDFNSEPSQEAYKYVTGEGSFKDAHELLPQVAHYGNEDTWTGFTDETRPSRIDFIFSKENGNNMTVQGYAVLPNVFEDSVFSSDHRAVVVDVSLALGS